MEKGFLLKQLRPSLAFLASFTLLFGFVYPMMTTLIIQIAFKEKANGSLIYSGDNLLGSALIGQGFSASKYFWSRPSATEQFPYDAAASTGSNLSTTNPILLANIQTRIHALSKADPKNHDQIPVDLVTSSASGLDPHISIAAAHYQVSRIAKARHMDEQKIKDLITLSTDYRQFGILGEPGVNVVRLNVNLDQATN
jgi:potassium-transporting ATPase KdpC subunit